MACSAPPFAAVSLGGKRRKGKVMTPEQESIFKEKLRALSPAELEVLRGMAQAAMMKAHKLTDDDGKKVRSREVFAILAARRVITNHIVSREGLQASASLMKRCLLARRTWCAAVIVTGQCWR